jgi:type II secretory pathway component PulF
MVAYRYKIRRNGSSQTGILEADSLQDATAQLRRLGGVVLQLRADTAKGRKPASGRSETKADDANKPAGTLRAVVNRLFILRSQVELTLRQLGSLLSAGVPILTAIRAVTDQAPPLLSRVYGGIGEKVRRGYPLQRCVKEEASFFGDVTIALIAVGEANGTLERMLTYSADLMEKARRIRGQIVQAFTYPAIVVLVAFGIGYFLVAHVFPKIMTFIQKQGKQVELPLPTRLLIQINDFLEVYGLYVLATPPLLIAAYFLARRVPAIGERLDYFKLRLPLIGKAFREHANARWCQTLGSLLGSGVDVLVALQLVRDTVGNLHYAAQFEKVREVVRQGGSLAKGIRESTLSRLCPIGLTMVSVSEETGGLDVTLLKVADYSEEQLSRRVGILGKVVEPAIFVVVGGMVGFVYFAFFMAMLAVTRSAA